MLELVRSNSKMKGLKGLIKYALKLCVIITPAFAANYAFVLYLGTMEIRSVSGISIVMVGDLIGAGINVVLMHHYRKWLAKDE